jgi:hypothetical protein
MLPPPAPEEDTEAARNAYGTSTVAVAAVTLPPPRPAPASAQKAGASVSKIPTKKRRFIFSPGAWEGEVQESPLTPQQDVEAGAQQRQAQATAAAAAGGIVATIGDDIANAAASPPPRGSGGAPLPLPRPGDRNVSRIVRSPGAATAAATNAATALGTPVPSRGRHAAVVLKVPSSLPI